MLTTERLFSLLRNEDERARQITLRTAKSERGNDQVVFLCVLKTRRLRVIRNVWVGWDHPFLKETITLYEGENYDDAISAYNAG